MILGESDVAKFKIGDKVKMINTTGLCKREELIMDKTNSRIKKFRNNLLIFSTETGREIGFLAARFKKIENEPLKLLDIL